MCLLRTTHALKPYEVGLWHDSQRCHWTEQKRKLESELNEETQKAISLLCACLCQALGEHVIEVNSEHCKDNGRLLYEGLDLEKEASFLYQLRCLNFCNGRIAFVKIVKQSSRVNCIGFDHLDMEMLPMCTYQCVP